MRKPMQIALLLLSVTVNIQSDNHGDLRLFGGETLYEGTLEFYTDEYGWGTVCNDVFDDNAGKVVCRQLKYGPLIEQYVRPGQENKPILVDDVKCTGTESRLDQCSYNEIPNHDCQHSEDVGIECTDNGAAAPSALKPNGTIYNLQYFPPDAGEYVSLFSGDVYTIGKVMTRDVDGSIYIQECIDNECDGNAIRHLDTARDKKYTFYTVEGEAVLVSITNPNIDKQICDCHALSCFGSDTHWGASYPISEGYSTTTSFKSDNAEHQIDFAEFITNEAAADGRKIIIASFLDTSHDNYFDFDTKFSSVLTEDYLKVAASTNVLELAQKATAQGIFQTAQGFDVITIILGADKLVEALDANGGGAHYYEFNKLLDRSGCYGDNNNTHTVLLLYHEEDHEVTGNGHRRFTPIPHLRFAPGLCGSTNDMSVCRSLSRQVITKYLCNDDCDAPAKILQDIDVTANSMIGLLDDLEYDTTTFCNNDGSWNDTSINNACSDEGLIQSNTCLAEDDESMCHRLVKYICGREAISNPSTRIQGKYTLAIDQGLGGCDTNGDIRLINGEGETSYRGRLEYYHDGQWGTVCDDDFDRNDNGGDVVCRQLGFGTFIRYFDATGGDDKPILLDNVECTGTESKLGDCPHRDIGVHNCGHNEDVGIECEAPGSSDDDD